MGAEAAAFSTIGTSVVLVLMTLISVPLMDHAGRRTLMLVGLGCIAVAELLITIMMTQVGFFFFFFFFFFLLFFF